MITEEQLGEIRHLLHDSERPLFFFDDDADGLCSYLLLKKYIGRGRGIVVKCSPVLDQQYVRKIHEYRPDRVFVLDKPIIEQDFVDEAKVQIVWIDHHPPVHIEGVHYFNPRLEDEKDNRPTSYWCYRVAKQNLWLAMCGIVGDWHIPEFAEDFAKEYPGLFPVTKDPGEALFNSGFGTLTRIISFLLKGPTSDVAKCIAILEKIETPYEILNQDTPRGKYIYKYFEKINKSYVSLLKDAMSKVGKDNFLVYTYPVSKLSFSGELSNELMHKFPDKFIIIGREKKDNVVLSIRSFSHDIPPMIEKALEGLEGYGGGHAHACGGNIALRDFHVFVERMKKLAKEGS